MISMAALSLTVVTPDREIVREEEVVLVLAPTVDGQVGILSSHAPLVTNLASGTLEMRRDGESRYLSITGGFMEVMNNNVVVLAEASEFAEDINRVRAERARDSAEHDLSVGRQTGDQDLSLTARSALSRANARLRTAERAQGV